MITATKINSLTDIDFDVLFDATLPALDAEANYWPSNVTSYDEKKSHSISVFNLFINTPKPCGLKLDIDGLTVSAMFGYIKDNQYNLVVGLMRDDENGSRDYVYDPAWLQAIKDFAASQGATSCLMHFYTGSKILEVSIDAYGITESDITYLTTDHSKPVTILRI